MNKTINKNSVSHMNYKGPNMETVQDIWLEHQVTYAVKDRLIVTQEIVDRVKGDQRGGVEVTLKSFQAKLLRDMQGDVTRGVLRGRQCQIVDVQ